MTERSIAILLPDDGVGEYEWHRLETVLGPAMHSLPPIVVGRVPSDGSHEPEALLALGRVARLLPVAEALRARHVLGGIIWACTSASFIGGHGFARRQARELQERVGVSASSTALLFLEALRFLGWERVDLLSPYPKAVTGVFMRFLSDDGVETNRVESLDCGRAADSQALDLVVSLRAFGSGNTEVPVIVPDTAIDSLHRGAELSSLAGRPVLTANQVTLWGGLCMVYSSARPDCLGALAA